MLQVNHVELCVPQLPSSDPHRLQSATTPSRRPVISTMLTAWVILAALAAMTTLAGCGTPPPPPNPYPLGAPAQIAPAPLRIQLAESRLTRTSLATDLTNHRYDRLRPDLEQIRQRFAAIADTTDCRLKNPAAYDSLIAGVNSTLTRLTTAAAREDWPACQTLLDGLEALFNNLVPYTR